MPMTLVWMLSENDQINLCVWYLDVYRCHMITVKVRTKLSGVNRAIASELSPVNVACNHRFPRMVVSSRTGSQNDPLNYVAVPVREGITDNPSVHCVLHHGRHYLHVPTHLPSLHFHNPEPNFIVLFMPQSCSSLVTTLHHPIVWPHYMWWSVIFSENQCNAKSSNCMSILTFRGS